MKELKTIGKDVGGNEGDKCNYNFRLDTYGCGCQHDCSYCYAKSLLNFRGLWNPENPSVADISKLIRAAKKYKQSGNTAAIRLGGMTDCFQPAEKLHRNTYRLIRAKCKTASFFYVPTGNAQIPMKRRNNE